MIPRVDSEVSPDLTEKRQFRTQTEPWVVQLASWSKHEGISRYAVNVPISTISMATPYAHPCTHHVSISLGLRYCRSKPPRVPFVQLDTVDLLGITRRFLNRPTSPALHRAAQLALGSVTLPPFLVCAKSGSTTAEYGIVESTSSWRRPDSGRLIAC